MPTLHRECYCTLRFIVEEGVTNTCIGLTVPPKLEKHYTSWIERRWHIPNKSPFPRLATDVLVSNALIQLEIVQYADGSGGSDVGM